jgi:hypothetical protein
MNKIRPIIFALLAFLTVSVKAVEAGPMLKLSPSTGSHDNGSTFDVVIGVDSVTAKTMAVDAFMTFDATKLDVVSIDAVSTGTTAFVFSMGKNIFNTEGKFDISFIPSADASISDSAVIKGDLATVKFKAKAVGTAAVNFTCVSGSSIDTNIFDSTGNDVIDCASNINGSYTINASSSSGSSSTVTPTTVVNNVTAAPGQLPKTGGFETTLGLMIFGIVGALAGVALKWL